MGLRPRRKARPICGPFQPSWVRRTGKTRRPFYTRYRSSLQHGSTLVGESFTVLVAETMTGPRHAPTLVDPQRPRPQLPAPLHADQLAPRRDPYPPRPQMGHPRDAPRHPIPPRRRYPSESHRGRRTRRVASPGPAMHLERNEADCHGARQRDPSSPSEGSVARRRAPDCCVLRCGCGRGGSSAIGCLARVARKREADEGKWIDVERTVGDPVTGRRFPPGVSPSIDVTSCHQGSAWRCPLRGER